MTGAKYRPSIYQSQSHLQIQRVPGICVNKMAELAGDLMTQMGQTDAEKAFRPWWEKLNLIQEIQLEIRSLLFKVGPHRGRDSLCVCCDG